MLIRRSLLKTAQRLRRQHQARQHQIVCLLHNPCDVGGSGKNNDDRPIRLPSRSSSVWQGPSPQRRNLSSSTMPTGTDTLVPVLSSLSPPSSSGLQQQALVPRRHEYNYYPSSIMARIIQRRRMSSSSSSLPYHVVVGLPALSPTMETGSLVEWYVKEGDTYSAGDAVAKIDTDKASIDFEAQDDGCVAKILVDSGSDLPVGTPIMITVEEPEDVGAFEDYVLPEREEPRVEVEAAGEADESPAGAPAPPPQVAAAAPPPPPPPPPAAIPPPPPPPPQAPVPAAAAAPPPPPAATTTSPASVKWGHAVAKTSPIAKSLAAQQSRYIELYGTTGQTPIVVDG